MPAATAAKKSVKKVKTTKTKKDALEPVVETLSAIEADPGKLVDKAFDGLMNDLEKVKSNKRRVEASLKVLAALAHRVGELGHSLEDFVDTELELKMCTFENIRAGHKCDGEAHHILFVKPAKRLKD